MNGTSIQQFNDRQHLIDASIPEDEFNYGVVYAVEFGENVKVGCTTDIHKRMANLENLANNYALSKLGRIAITGYCCNRYECEAEAHAKLAEYRIGNSEMFNVSFETAVDALSGLHLHVMTKQEHEELEARSQEFANALKDHFEFGNNMRSEMVIAGLIQTFARIRRAAIGVTDWMLDDIENGDQSKAMMAAGVALISEIVCDWLLDTNADIDKTIETLLDEHKLAQWLFNRINDEIEFYGVNNDAELSI